MHKYVRELRVLSSPSENSEVHQKKHNKLLFIVCRLVQLQNIKKQYMLYCQHWSYPETDHFNQHLSTALILATSHCTRETTTTIHWCAKKIVIMPKQKKTVLFAKENVINEGWLRKSPPRKNVNNPRSWKCRFFRLLKLDKDVYVSLIKVCKKKNEAQDYAFLEELPSVYCVAYWSSENKHEDPIRMYFSLILILSTIAKIFPSEMLWLDPLIQILSYLNALKKCHLFSPISHKYVHARINLPTL